MPDLVGEPVLVNDDDPAETTTQVQELNEPSHMRDVNCLCCVGSILIVLQGFSLVFDAHAYIWDSKPHYLRIVRGVPTISCVLSIYGLCYMRRAQLLPGGCECLSCRGPCIPRSLFVLNGESVLGFIISVSEIVKTSSMDGEWYLGIISCFFSGLSACTMFWLSLHWMWRFNKQSLEALQTCSDHAENENPLRSESDGENAQARFAHLDSQESRRPEAAYVVAQAILLLGSFVVNETLTSDDAVLEVAKWHSVILLMCFFYRTYRLAFAAPGARVSMFATVFDAFEFSWIGFALGMTGNAVIGSFFLNVLLSYMLLFVFPFRRGLIVGPLCYTIYSTSVAFAADSVVEESSMKLSSLLGLGLCLNLFARRAMQDSKWKAFLLIEEKTKLAVQEKVLRFQAEFSSEVKPRAGLARGTTTTSSYPPSDIQGNILCASGDACSRVGQVGVVPYASSVNSAPAMLTFCLEHSTDVEAVNCLPLDALAWVEGEACPRPLEQLQAGSRVLCYDRLGGSLKHAALLDVQRKDGPVEWTTVTLADGATLEMTSDHPMQPMDSHEAERGNQMAGTAFLSRPGLPVRAADLKPGEHSLVFMQVVPNMVQSVTSILQSKPRMALTIQQPERHALFVASPGNLTNGSIQTMAVESVNVKASSCIQMSACQSFLKLSHPCEQNERKAASAPPSLDGPTHVQSYPAASSPTSLHSPMCMESHSAAEDCDSVCSSSSEFSSADRDEILFGPLPVLGSNVMSSAGNGSHNGRDAAAEDLHYKLSDILHLRKAGLQSRGSVHHSSGQCATCAHENKRHWYHASPCFKGAFCERCHEVHDNLIQAKRIRRRNQRNSERTNQKSSSNLIIL